MPTLVVGMAPKDVCINPQIKLSQSTTLSRAIPLRGLRGRGLLNLPIA